MRCVLLLTIFPTKTPFARHFIFEVEEVALKLVNPLEPNMKPGYILLISVRVDLDDIDPGVHDFEGFSEVQDRLATFRSDPEFRVVGTA